MTACDASDPSCVNAVDSLNDYPVSVPTGGTTDNIFESESATGEGVIDIATGWWIFDPPEAQAGTYTNVITATITSGP
jgi:hypothetical protein